ncbi:MAG: ribosomal protein S18-alanine N-acetyltransferase [Acidimicrobiales bacterium]
MTVAACYLRPMVEADIGPALAVDELVYPSAWSPSFLRQQLSLAGSRVNLVAEREGQLVGHGALMVVADEGHVTSVAVHPHQQRQGVGAQILAALCRASVERGLKSMTLEVRCSNEAAIGLYQRFGFAPAGVRVGYYADTGEDALIMWVHDIDQPEFLGRVAVAEKRKEHHG